MAHRHTQSDFRSRLPFSDPAEAEHILLDLADYIYGHTALKPMSKTLFLMSRCLLAVAFEEDCTPGSLVSAYRRASQALKRSAPEDDFDFAEVVDQCKHHLVYVIDALRRVRHITQQTDTLGLAFNTLLRGKYEGGEGLGTFLTPEEVVAPMVEMLLAVADDSIIQEFRKPHPKLLYGDICGGTGRFVYAMTKRLSEEHGCRRKAIERSARLFDQSSFAVDCARLNFAFEGLQGDFRRVGDSLIDDDISRLGGAFGLLAANPPFGTSKYRWNLWLDSVFPRELLKVFRLEGSDDAADPSELFFFRNLDLLAPGGALAIVLPDGLVHSERFRQALSVYEQARSSVEITAVVSLPVVTFTLGGTVAKTSFLLVHKARGNGSDPLYVANAEHVGFQKKGNRRIADPRGNDLVEIARDFCSKSYSLGTRLGNWRRYHRLSPSGFFADGASAQPNGRPVRDVAEPVRQPAARWSTDPSFHVSVLDVDQTGLIDIVSASRNRPATPGLLCQPGDVILSCINPRIWRVAVIPPLPGSWSCSGEFLVLRPRSGVCPWQLAARLHHRDVSRAVQQMAGGTSSSRQRVHKPAILDVPLPALWQADAELKEHSSARTGFYRERLREARAYARLHEGESTFQLSDGNPMP